MIRRLRATVLRLLGSAGLYGSERDLAEELESHLQLHIDDNVRAGMSPEQARRAALIKLGGIEASKERYRDQRGLRSLDALWQDVRHAVRALVKRPILLAAATTSIGLGVGINVTVYSILRQVFFDPWITAPAPERLVGLMPGLSFVNYEDLQARDTLVDFALLTTSTLTWRTPGGTTTLGGQKVSRNFFDVVGVKPWLGRTFSAVRPDSGQTNAAESHGDLAVVAFSFWQQRLGSDLAVIGRTIILDGRPYVIAAVLPKEFYSTLGPMIAPSVYIPIRPESEPALSNRTAAYFDVIGRLRDGATREQAAVAVRAATQDMEARIPGIGPDFSRSLSLTSGGGPFRDMLREAPSGRIVMMLAAAMYGLVGLVLLITCANVAGVLAARADERWHEIAVCVALGATRARLAQRFLAESLVIGLIGSVMGAGLWLLCATLIPRNALVAGAGVAIVPAAMPLLYCLALVVVVTIVCGLAPILTASQVSPGAGLQARRTGSIFHRFMLQRVLVGAQVAICFVLLSAAGVLLHAFVRLRSVDPGFDVARTAGISMRLPSGAQPRGVEALKRALERVPGVEAVSYGDLPLALLPRTSRVRSESGPDNAWLPIDLHPVGARYLATMGIPLVRGRDLIDADAGTAGSLPVVVNETFTRRSFESTGRPDEELVLDRNTETGRPARRLRIVGVARDVKTRSLGDEGLAVVYMPVAAGSLVVRSREPALAIVRRLEETARRLFPDAVVTATPMTARITTALRPSQIGAGLLGTLGGLGLLLAAVGLHGVISYATSRRTFEIGVRMALGATKSAVLNMVLRDAARLVVAGCVAGGLISLAAVQVLRPLLAVGQSPIDPLALVTIPVVLLAIGATASFWPAHRAARVEPAIALRHD